MNPYTDKEKAATSKVKADYMASNINQAQVFDKINEIMDSNVALVITNNWIKIKSTADKLN